MDNEEVGRAFLKAGKQESALDTSGLTPLQAVYSKAIYGHLRSSTSRASGTHLGGMQAYDNSNTPEVAARIRAMWANLLT